MSEVWYEFEDQDGFVWDRPCCQSPDCTKPAARTGYYWDGEPRWRKWCHTCHSSRTAAKHGLTKMIEITARRNGFEDYTDYRNSKHPYLKHRKTHCENTDGRLGFKCTTTIFWKGMLDVDHINGDPTDHREENLQTLCKCCHAYKTIISGDHATPGRKALAA